MVRWAVNEGRWMGHRTQQAWLICKLLLASEGLEKQDKTGTSGRSTACLWETDRVVFLRSEDLGETRGMEDWLAGLRQ